MNALTLLNDLPVMLNIDDDMLEPYIIKSYIGIRLRPLIGMPGATETKLNALANIFSTMYFTENYTLDILINSVYNYINATGRCPANELYNKDVDLFLEEYGENNA